MFDFLKGAKKEKSAALDRERIAGLYLRGEGIEIGALHNPLKTPEGLRVRYVDRMPVEQLREQYPELKELPLVEPDVIDNGERLEQFAEASVDFVIANHFLEHCANPILAIENFLRVLRPGGVVYLAVPDKRFTFDKERPTTTLEHLMRDYREGPEWSRRQAFEEWIRIVNKVDNEEWAQDRIAHYMAIDYSIHYHAWTQTELLELFAALKRELGFPFDLEFFLRNGEECIFILKKS